MSSRVPPRPRALAESVVGWIDRAAARVGALGPGAFAWPCLIGMGLGVGLLGLRRPAFVDGMLKRRATLEFTRPALTAVLAATVATVLLSLTIALVQKRRGRADSVGSAYVTALERVAFLSALPLVIALEEPLEPGREWLVLTFAVVTAALATYSTRSWMQDGAREKRRALEIAAPLVVGMASVAYVIVMSRLAIQHHLGFSTGRSDLGVALSILQETNQGRLLQCTLCISGATRHFEPIYLLLAPLFRLHPTAETLLVFQTACLALGAPAVFLSTRRLTGSAGAGALLALSYLAYPALHGENLAGFHAVTLATPLFLWLLHFLERGAPRRYFAMVVLLLLVREDIVLPLSAVSLFAILSGSRGQARLGFLTLAGAAVYSLAVVATGHPSPFAMLSFATQRPEVLLRARSRLRAIGEFPEAPVSVLVDALSMAKMDYLAKLAVPLLGIPLLARGRVLLAYGAALALLSTKPELFATLYSEHATFWVPFAYALGTRGLARAAGPDLAPPSRPRLARALPVGVLVATLLCSLKLGAFLENGSFRAGSRALIRSPSAADLTASAWLDKIARSLPKGARVAATARVSPHLGRAGHLYGIEERGRADYVIGRLSARSLVAKALGDEEAKGRLSRADSYADLRLYRTRYRGFVPPAPKSVDDE